MATSTERTRRWYVRVARTTRGVDGHFEESDTHTYGPVPEAVGRTYVQMIDSWAIATERPLHAWVARGPFPDARTAEHILDEMAGDENAVALLAAYHVELATLLGEWRS